ncbi:MAG: prepilin-type N-terminal cleavage/methylation domain-containing protein [Candidatus Omnitrophica bacterium]|nr:prepilin-type N-terminal cleavage/methylation domain-containing protein [Candidatus Omnitrophota bacterium]
MRKRSFTLIELLIVIVIIGIIASLAVPQFEIIILKTESIEAKTTLRVLEDAMWRRYIETGEFPEATESGDLPASLLDEMPSLKFDADIGAHVGKHWSYGYSTTQGGFSVAAARLVDVPVGIVFRYEICYFQGQPSPQWQGVQRVNDTWWKQYRINKRTGPTSYLYTGGWE